MNIGARSSTQEINAQIIEDYYEVPLSVKALEEKYGRHESTINKLIGKYKAIYKAENGVDRVRKGKPQDPRRLGDPKPLTFRHYIVGLNVTRYMDEHELSVTGFGHLISRSPSKITRIKAGSYPLTLEEVDKIAEVLGVDFNTLLLNQSAEGNRSSSCRRPLLELRGRPQIQMVCW